MLKYNKSSQSSRRSSNNKWNNRMMKMNMSMNMIMKLKMLRVRGMTMTMKWLECEKSHFRKMNTNTIEKLEIFNTKYRDNYMFLTFVLSYSQ